MRDRVRGRVRGGGAALARKLDVGGRRGEDLGLGLGWGGVGLGLGLGDVGEGGVEDQLAALAARAALPDLPTPEEEVRVRVGAGAGRG